ncbi:MAG: hypothetical protein QT11_C0001G0308 [archaeon GW2011_AR20]|nr:MAG: hypothetical protein QT11_C0001G0308 [archaeon GW2011_AR20]AQS28476.1 hypothetical protein [uncultured archaeon]MBS3160315.1 hypothetical protein [Candidatus Woesearchaeota archaeon]
MATISKDLFKRLVDEGFFDAQKSIKEVVERLDQKGFSISGKKISLASQLLTFLCQEHVLERKKNSGGEWMYFKIKNG